MFKTVTKSNDEVIAARRAILLNFMNNGWSQVAPKAITPFGDDGKTIRNEKNFNAFAAMLHAYTVVGEGTRPITDEVLRSLVAELDKEGALEHYAERIVEVEKKVPLTRKEALKAEADLNRKMNNPNRDVIKGRGEFDHQTEKPRASQAQLEAQAAHDLRQNELMGEVNSAIQMHRGKSHGATDAERKILQGIRDAGIENNLDNAVILEQVQAKRSEMVNWDNQRAIREVYANKFRERGVDISQRTPSKYGE